MFHEMEIWKVHELFISYVQKKIVWWKYEMRIKF